MSRAACLRARTRARAGGRPTTLAAAIAALFLYSLLPIVRNTCEGLRGVPLELREAAHRRGQRAELDVVEGQLAQLREVEQRVGQRRYARAAAEVQRLQPRAPGGHARHVVGV